ncbi:MAG: hypothetical protein HLUCCA11_15070 [Phormidesmis priestleyi Ana]|uniref:Uncharacterized protein n=1 Tax=Phormidesmis priestleyi Ana TaxID=1666911 RepID=A0A0P8DDW6_9CYAN|nr:MAG: hypothetical protein HLUCCA11_15070 [Phormidesmis priestleyi Ana]
MRVKKMNSPCPKNILGRGKAEASKALLPLRQGKWKFTGYLARFLALLTRRPQPDHLFGHL